MTSIADQADDDADTMLDIFGETITHRAQASPLAETEIVAFVERKMSQQDDTRGLGILERAEIQIRTGDVSLTLRDSFVIDSTEMFVDAIGLTAGGLTPLRLINRDSRTVTAPHRTRPDR